MITKALRFTTVLASSLAVLIAAPVVRGAAPTDIRQGLVAYWPLDESPDGTTTPDVSPFGNHLQLVNMDASNFVPGHTGNAAQFNGSDEILSKVYTAGLDIGLPISPTRRFTVALWVNGVGSSQGDRRIFSEGSTANSNPLFNLGTDSASTGRTNVLDVYIRNDGGTAVVSHRKSTGNPFDGTWHHVAWVQDGNTGRLYIDGLADPTDFSYGAATLTLNTISLGGIQRAAAGSFFAGKLDDVAVWERALSAAEIQNVMNNGIATPVPELVPLIVAEPTSATARLGDNVTLRVAAVGNRPLSYQWVRDGADIPGANGTTYAILNAGVADGGDYAVRVQNIEGATASAVAHVTVLPDPPADLRNGLISYWPLDTLDEAALTTPDLYSQNDLSLVNMSVLDQVPGNTGLDQALQFDGVIKYARRTTGIPTYNSLAHSISFWVRGNGAAQLDLRVFAEGSTNNNTPLFTFGTMPSPGGSGLRVFIRNDANATSLAQNSTRPVFDNLWHHVVWTDSNGIARVYIDGVQDPSDFRYTRSGLTLNTTAIGGILRAAAGSLFSGEIDEVAVWNRQLTYTEVGAIFAGRVPPPIAIIPPEITRQPAGADVFEGADILLAVEAIGSSLQYQWARNGTPIPDATNAVLLLAGSTTADSADYTVQVRNSAASLTSQPATVLVSRIVDATSGLVAYWPLDVVNGNNLTPDVINGNALTLVNMDNSNVVPGRRGNALSFNGVDELAVRRHADGSSVGLPVYRHAEFTVALWVNGIGNAQASTPVNGDRRVFSEASTTNGNPLFNLGTDNANASYSGDVYVRNDAGSVGIDHRKTVATPFDGAWHHLAYVQTLTGGHVYVDGALDGTDFSYSRSPLTPDTTSIGGIVRAADSHWFLGLIDDVALWRRALSDAEIRYVMNNGAVPPPALRVNQIAITGNTVTLTYTAPEPDSFYCIQQTDSLVSPNWLDVPAANIIAVDGNVFTVEFTRTDGDLRFYRVYHCP